MLDTTNKTRARGRGDQEPKDKMLPRAKMRRSVGGMINAALTQASRPRSSQAAAADTAAACGPPAAPGAGGAGLCQRPRARLCPVLPPLLLFSRRVGDKQHVTKTFADFVLYLVWDGDGGGTTLFTG